MADRVERLTNLLALLLETQQPLSLDTIANELSGQYPDGLAARRGAFERDKASLRNIGVPIEQEITAGGDVAGQTRYWIDRERYELADLELDDDERRALQVAMAATRPSSAAAQDALWKVGAGIAPTSQAVTAVLPDDPNLPTVRQAVSDRISLTFRYGDVEREVDPWALLLRDGFWYLVGFDRVRDARRTYRLDRVQSAVEPVEGSSFERPSGFRADDAFPSDPKLIGVTDEPVFAHVRVSGPLATLVQREVQPNQIIDRGEHSVVVEVPASNTAAFRSWLIEFGAAAEVVGPPAVRAETIAWLTEAAS